MKFKFILLILLFSLSSQANLIMEPFLTYESGSVKGTENFGAQTTTDKDLTGHTAGVLFSFAVYKGLGLNVVYGQSSTTLESNNTKQDVTFRDYGPYFAIPINERWNLWFSYIISNSNNYTKQTASNGKINGTGMRYGVGFMAAPHVRLNLEFQNINYDNVNGGNSTDEVALSRRSLLFTIGFPFLVWEAK